MFRIRESCVPVTVPASQLERLRQRRDIGFNDGTRANLLWVELPVREQAEKPRVKIVGMAPIY
jgi:hypothetical protein